MNKLGKCIRAFLVLYNVIIMAAGSGAIVMIIWMIISRSFLGKLIGLHMYIGLLYILLTASFFAVSISFFGCYGAANSVKWMLYLYGAILSVVFLLVFIASILGLLIKDWMTKMVRHSLLYCLNLYSENQDISQAWDEIQSFFKCCGVDSFEDWSQQIPQSCCKTIEFILDPRCDVTSKPPAEIYTDGCYNLLSKFVSSNVKYIFALGLTTGLLEILCAAFSFSLAAFVVYDEVVEGRNEAFRRNSRRRPKVRDSLS